MVHNVTGRVQIEKATTYGVPFTLKVDGLLLFCGTCDRPFSEHPIEVDNILVCDRTEPYAQGTDTDLDNRDDYYGYWGYTDSGYPVSIPLMPYADYSGNAARISSIVSDDGTLDFEIGDAYISVDYEQATLDAWRDQDSLATTHADSYYYTHNGTTRYGSYADHHIGTIVTACYNSNHGPEHANGSIKCLDKTCRQQRTSDATSAYGSDETRNAFVEGFEGFLSIQVIDETLTDQHHRRLLNWFFDKRTNTARVGSLKFLTVNGSLRAECVHRECSFKDSYGNWGQRGINIDVATATRDEQEAFILSVIRHGNNHAAKFIRERDDYYKVHTSDCDLNCDRSALACNSNAPKELKTSSDSEDFNPVEFLFEHQRYCTDSKCKCSDWLAHLVPALSA